MPTSIALPATLVGIALAASPASPRAEAFVLLAHGFDGAETQDVALEIRPVPGDVRERGGARVDHADYADAGSLVLARDLEFGPPGATSLVPAGTYRLDFLPWSGTGPVVRLTAGDGLRLQVPLPVIPPPPRAVRALSAEALGGDAGGPWMVALHSATVSGLLVVAPASAEVVAAGEAGSQRSRPRTRGDLVRERIRGRSRPAPAP